MFKSSAACMIILTAIVVSAVVTLQMWLRCLVGAGVFVDVLAVGQICLCRF